MSDPASDQSSNGGLGQSGSLSSEGSELNYIAQGRRSYCDLPLQEAVALQAAKPHPVGRAHFEGPPTEASNTLPSRAVCASSHGGDLSGSHQPLCPEMILQWIDIGEISFEEKIEQSFKNAVDAKKKAQKKEAEDMIKKMAKEAAGESECNDLELKCDLCDESFVSEDEFKEHYVSKEHLAKVPYTFKCNFCNTSFLEETELRIHCDSEKHIAKVKEKSANKTYGDLKKFADTSETILSRVLGPPAPAEVSDEVP